MKNKVLKIIIAMFAVAVFALNTTAIMAAGNSGSFVGSAAEWWNGQDGNVSGLDGGVIGELATIVEVIGTGVIAIATVVLGIKYMLGSAQDKTDVKENLITLLVACIFFFGWTNIRNILITGASFGSAGEVVIHGTSGFLLIDNSVTQGEDAVINAMSTIFSVVLFIGKVVILGVTVYMGVKLIYGGAEQKAKMKERGIMYVMGIIMILLTTQLLTFLNNAITHSF